MDRKDLIELIYDMAAYLDSLVDGIADASPVWDDYAPQYRSLMRRVDTVTEEENDRV